MPESDATRQTAEVTQFSSFLDDRRDTTCARKRTRDAALKFSIPGLRSCEDLHDLMAAA